SRIWGTILAGVVLLAGALAAAAQTPIPAGRYLGIGESEGMRIDARPGPGRLGGTIRDVNGKLAALDLLAVGEGFEGVAEFTGRDVFLTVFGAPDGLIVVALPLDAAGAPLAGRDRVLVFVPEGSELTRIPAGVMPPPTTSIFVDPDVFVNSYRYWPPEGVARGWVGLESRFRPLIALYPVVLTDILGEVCRSGARPAELGEALRGQGVSCDQITGALDRMRRSGTLVRFKRDVEAEIGVLMNAIQCARGYTLQERICGPAARRTSEAAVSLVTIGAVLGRY
ncbi:MAG: hypothetical protein AAFW69_10140, partial [Pseudomonadota bacterium]